MNNFLSLSLDKKNPIIAVALHAGHELRPDVLQQIKLSDAERLKEEDPCTNQWVKRFGNRLAVSTSRFEVDLNRPRNKAVYLKPRDSWGMEIWKESPGAGLIDESLKKYDLFYDTVKTIFTDFEDCFQRFVVLDIHSYNSRHPEANSSASNPEINVGTGTMDRAYWGRLVDAFIKDLSAYQHKNVNYDVRENINFRGGYFAKWAHTYFPYSACVLSIEVKKTYINEKTGELNMRQVKCIEQAIVSTIPGLCRNLGKLRN